MAEQTPDAPPRKKRDFLSVLGMVAVAGAAAFTSYSGLDRLALMADWPSQLALMLPITIDAYAMTATRVWLSPAKLTRKARNWARGNAIGAIATSVAGNMLYHAAAAHVLAVSWPVVVGISAIPSVVLGLTVHLWHTAEDTEPEPEPEPKQSPGPAIAEPETVRAAYPILGNAAARALPASAAAKQGAAARVGAARPAAAARGSNPRPVAPRRTAADLTKPDKAARDAEQLARARELDAESWTQRQVGISARQLEKELHIGSHPARALAKQLAAERGQSATTAPGSTPAPAAPANPPAAPEPPGPVTPRAASAAPEPHLLAASPGAVPGPRPAPVERANGASIDTS